VYLGASDWKKAADYYWLAAEVLAKDSFDMSFGVANLYVFSAAAYLLCDNVEKADDAIRRTRGILRNPKVDDRGVIGFLLEIVEAIRNGDVQELEERAKLLRVVKDRFEMYGEEAALLVKRNLDHTQQQTNHKQAS
jgi:hypothetical protein